MPGVATGAGEPEMEPPDTLSWTSLHLKRRSGHTGWSLFEWTDWSTVVSSLTRQAVVAYCLAGLCSFITVAYKLNLWAANDPWQAEKRGVLREEVPDMLLAMPVTAFGGVMLLNALNLRHSMHNDTRFKSNIVLCFVVLVAFSTDMLILLGMTPIAVAGNMRLLYPLRFFQWSHSTPAMIFMLSLTSDLPKKDVVLAMLCDVSMILCGLASTLSTTMQMRVLFAVLSFSSFGVVLFHLGKIIVSASKAPSDPHARAAFNAMLLVTRVVWMLYPIVWVAVELDTISAATEQLVWFLLEYVAKAVFTSQLWQTNIKTVDERSRQALETWENSNRAMVVGKLQHLVSSKESMLNVMSHELMTPLMGIMAMSSNLLRSYRAHRRANALPPKASEQLAMIRSCASCLVNLVNSTLETSKAGVAGVQETEGGPDRSVRLHLIVKEVMALMAPLAHQGVKLVTEVPDDLPPVAGSRAKLSHIFFNLIGNAAKVTFSGCIKVTASSDGGDRVRVQRGVGRPPGQLQHIFSSPARDDAPGTGEMPSGEAVGGGHDRALAAAYGSTGLSLYLVKLAVASHGSDVNVVTDEGDGTVFSFSLRVAGDSAVEDNGRDPFDADGGSSHADASDLGSSMDALIDSIAEQPVRADSQDSAVAERVRASVDSPLHTRLKMPQRLRLGSRTLQVLSVDDDIINQGLRAGADDYVTKPFKRTELVERIKSHVRARDLSDFRVMATLTGASSGLDSIMASQDLLASVEIPVAVRDNGDSNGRCGVARCGSQKLQECYMGVISVRVSGLEQQLQASCSSRGGSSAQHDATPGTLPSLLDLHAAFESSTSTGNGSARFANSPAGVMAALSAAKAELLAALQKAHAEHAPRWANPGDAASTEPGSAGRATHVSTTSEPAPVLAAQTAAASAAAAAVALALASHPLLTAAAALSSSLLDALGSGAGARPASPPGVASASVGHAGGAGGSAASSAVAAPRTSGGDEAHAVPRDVCGVADLARDAFAALLPLSDFVGRDQALGLGHVLTALSECGAGLRWPDGSTMSLQAGVHCCKVRVMRPAGGGSASHRASRTSWSNLCGPDRTSSTDPLCAAASPWPCCLLLGPPPEMFLAFTGTCPLNCIVVSDAARVELAAAEFVGVGHNGGAPSSPQQQQQQAGWEGGGSGSGGGLPPAAPPPPPPLFLLPLPLPRAVRCAMWTVTLPFGAEGSSAAAGGNGGSTSGGDTHARPPSTLSTHTLPHLRLYLAELGLFRAALSAGPTLVHGAFAAAACALGLLPPTATRASSGGGMVDARSSMNGATTMDDPLLQLSGSLLAETASNNRGGGGSGGRDQRIMVSGAPAAASSSTRSGGGGGDHLRTSDANSGSGLSFLDSDLARALSSHESARGGSTARAGGPHRVPPSVPLTAPGMGQQRQQQHPQQQRVHTQGASPPPPGGGAGGGGDDVAMQLARTWGTAHALPAAAAYDAELSAQATLIAELRSMLADRLDEVVERSTAVVAQSMIGQLWAETQMLRAELAATQRRLSITPGGSNVSGGGGALLAAHAHGHGHGYGVVARLDTRSDSGLSATSHQSHQSAASHTLSIITLAPREDSTDAETPVGSLDPWGVVPYLHAGGGGAAHAPASAAASVDHDADAAVGAPGLAGGSPPGQEGEAGGWYARRW
ncbi:hypothetical protein FOA52_014235 [Chlamydomonas sp. UWO 241]|nr:hypothetical protein FOA52_014235 [Chlamydomonas sp. UWO 241]